MPPAVAPAPAPETERPAAVQVAPEPVFEAPAAPAPVHEPNPWGDLGNGSRSGGSYANRQFAPERPAEPVAETPAPTQPEARDPWDPRLAALAMSPDFEAAEAEAAAAARSADASEEIPTIGDDALAARL